MNTQHDLVFTEKLSLEQFSTLEKTLQSQSWGKLKTGERFE